MFARRSCLIASTVSVSAPIVVRGQSPEIGEMIGRLSRLHSLQIQRGEDVIFAQAPKEPGLDRPANIRPCSKSIVALLLETAIDRQEISSDDATLQDVAPRLLPPNATPGAESITMEDLVTLRAGLERTSGGNCGAWISSPNWIADALTRPMVAKPG